VQFRKSYKNIKDIPKEEKIRLQIKQYTNKGDSYPMAARSKVIAPNDEPFKDMDFAAFEEEEESTAEELHALIDREKGEFISLNEYLKRRGIE
jgi:hypothetical protein